MGRSGHGEAAFPSRVRHRARPALSLRFRPPRPEALGSGGTRLFRQRSSDHVIRQGCSDQDPPTRQVRRRYPERNGTVAKSSRTSALFGLNSMRSSRLCGRYSIQSPTYYIRCRLSAAHHPSSFPSHQLFFLLPDVAPQRPHHQTHILLPLSPSPSPPPSLHPSYPLPHQMPHQPTHNPKPHHRRNTHKHHPQNQRL